MPTPADLIVLANWLIPVAGSGHLIEDGAVVVSNGKVVETGDARMLSERYDAAESVCLPQHILLPGLVNAHCHGAMSLLRGHAEDTPLQTWLEERVWPLEARWVDARFVRDGVRLAIVEMVRAGITCFADMYYFPEITAEESRAAGIRTQAAFPVIDFANVWSTSAENGIHQGLELHDEYRHEPLVHIAFGPHAVYSVASTALEKILMFSEELEMNVHIHLHENCAEVAQSRKRFGTSGIRYLHDRGLLSPRLQAVHMTQIEPGEFELLAETNVQVIHCPTSNAKLASGVSPTTALTAAGINVGLGTDGAASNNRLSILAEARLASLLAKLEQKDAAALPAPSVLAMATLGGAKALGLENQIGTLEPGKWADFIAIDTRAPELQPLFDPFAQLLHAGADNNVTHVWIGGRCVLENREFTSMDEQSIVANAVSWQQQISRG